MGDGCVGIRGDEKTVRISEAVAAILSVKLQDNHDLRIYIVIVDPVRATRICQANLRGSEVMFSYLAYFC